MIEAVRQDLAHAVRRLLRAPGPALLAVGTLAIGIGATTSVFTVVDSVLLRPLSYSDPGRMVALFAHERSRGERRAPTSPADFLEWKKVSRTVDELTAAHPWSPVLRGRGPAEQLRGLKATPGLFDLLAVPAALGRVWDGEELQVVLGHDLWQRRFGADPTIVGQSLDLDGRSYRVSGVMPPGFRFPPFWAEADLWVPLVFDAEQETSHAAFLRVFGRLRPGATLAQARAEMDVVGERLAGQWPRTNANVGVTVEPLREPVVSRARPALLVLLGAVVLVLLIACANVASLLLAQGLSREKDAAIRAALGAGRVRLVRLRLLESVGLALTGGALGLAGANLGVSVLSTLGGVGLPRAEEIAVDARVAAFAIAASLLAGLVSGLVPALRASRPDLVPSLKRAERVASDTGAHRLHDLLVIGEFAMAVVLLVGAGLLVQTFLHLQSPRTGFDAESLLSVDLSLSGSTRGEGEQRPALLADIVESVRTVPGARDAAFVNHLPIGGDTWRTRFTVEGHAVSDPADIPQAVIRTATPGYLSTMGTPLLRGRPIDAADRADDAPVVLVNQTLARQHWPDGGALGARIRLGGADSDAPWRTVVGVVADSRQSGPADPVEPEIEFPYSQDPVGWYSGTTLVVRAAGDPRSLAEAVVARVRSAAPDLPIVRVRTMPELLTAASRQERFGALLMTLLSAVALALAVSGIYAVTAYAVGRRTREIGVRLALGARPGEVQRMFVRQGLRLGLVGAAVGLAGASALSGALRGLLYGVSPTDPLTFVEVGTLLLTVAALGSLVPARRAARLDPSAVLREP